MSDQGMATHEISYPTQPSPSTFGVDLDNLKSGLSRMQISDQQQTSPVNVPVQSQDSQLSKISVNNAAMPQVAPRVRQPSETSDTITHPSTSNLPAEDSSDAGDGHGEDDQQPPQLPPSESESPGEQLQINPQPRSTPSNQENVHITLSMLTRQQYDLICHELDTCTSANVPRWQYLVDKEYSEPKKRRLIVGNLNLVRRGGGNPGLLFLINLDTKRSDLACKEFRDVAASYDRDDINKAAYLQGDGFMWELVLDDKLNLAALLNVPNVADWEYFAENYKFTKQAIEQIRNDQGNDGNRSPGLKLLRDTFGNMTTTRFIELCKSNHFHLIANNMERIEKEIQNSR